MEHIYHFAHIGIETWDTEPIKVIIGVEIWFLVCLLIAWWVAAWRLKVKRSLTENTWTPSPSHFNILDQPRHSEFTMSFNLRRNRKYWNESINPEMIWERKDGHKPIHQRLLRPHFYWVRTLMDNWNSNLSEDGISILTLILPPYIICDSVTCKRGSSIRLIVRLISILVVVFWWWFSSHHPDHSPTTHVHIYLKRLVQMKWMLK